MRHWISAATVAFAFCLSGCATDVCELDGDCSVKSGRCVDGQCLIDLDPAPAGHVDLGDGWDAPFGAGRVFIIDELAIADEGQGFDLDGQCRGPGDCVDNALFRMGDLGNDQIRQGLLGGETLMVFEIAGIDEPFQGEDERVSWKIYPAEDADDLFFPANNFQVPQGEDTCCEFRVSQEWFARSGEQPQVGGRGALDRYRLSSSGRIDLSYVVTTGDEPYPVVQIVLARVSAKLLRADQDPKTSYRSRPSPHGTDNLTDGLIGGTIPAGAVARIPNPYCKTLNQLCPRQLPDSTMIDLVASFMQPDIDVDGDGLETLEVGALGRVNRCIDGDGTRIPPTDVTQPWSCALQPQMADGFSIALRFHGVPARIVP